MKIIIKNMKLNLYQILIVLAISGPIIIHKYVINNVRDEIAPIIYFWTLLAILWYSKETRELKEISIKRPYLSFYINKDKKIKLKNYGEGAARDIKIIINSGEEIKIQLMSSVYGSQYGIVEFTDEENKLLQECKNEITITYYDISGKIKYTTKNQLDNSINSKDKCEIIYYGWK